MLVLLPARECAADCLVPWILVAVEADAETVGCCCARLEALGAMSVCVTGVDDARAEPVLEPAPGATPLWARSRIEACFAPDVEIASVRDALVQVATGEPTARQHGAPTLSIRFLRDEDWVARSRATSRPLRFGDRLCIVSRDTESTLNDAVGEQVVVRLDPGLAFGTGEHPTTALCLEWLDRHVERGWSVVDYGCGSGVLGIAAAMLGACEVLAVDHDTQALTATRINAAAQDGACRLRVLAPDEIELRARHDLVVANILADPLVSLSPRLTALLRPGGWMVLSGLLVDQVQLVAAAYPTAELQVGGVRDGWVLLAGRKTG